MLDRRTLVCASPIIALAAASGAMATTQDKSDSNKTFVRRFFTEVWSTGNLDLRDEFLAPDYRGHISGSAAAIDREGWAGWFRGFRSAFPDASFTVDDIIGEGELVAARLTMRGTHLGTLNGIPPTERSVVVSGMSIERIVEGRIVEGWNENDALGMLAQLGVFPPPAA
ncbi:ester cyclase [Parafrankia sp. BMG5.11]|uniref:ester cyclase n=1 Tax=Parafrankia sp. BMG5.11 TaxID=222540 RepID=UPI00103C8254|nr:ester cyclase [Parafrankia sp. BMG5.11]TCJ38387.1 ester cyclase [Parafrankia sp. BMG5.11]